MKKKLLIINRSQFGYHIDTYSYCKYAKDFFAVTYLGFDTGRAKLDIEGVTCCYVSRKGILPERYFRFFIACCRECRKDYSVIFVVYFLGCAFLKAICKNKVFVLDVRTGSVNKNFIARIFADKLLKIETCFFENLTIISRSLANKLRLTKKAYHVLPLGADPVIVDSKQFKEIKLLYVGTFTGRRIGDTIEGFAKFFHEYKYLLDITYDVIGDGHFGEREKLKDLVEKLGIGSVLSLPGYIHKSKLQNYYSRCNFGVSYIPINEIYDCQPPTKTYEYLMAGMPVIATRTKENTLVVNENNGVLIGDSASDFYDGLKYLISNRGTYDSLSIRDDMAMYAWQNIVETNFVVYINRFA